MIGVGVKSINVSYDALNRLSAVQSHYIPGQPSTQYSYTALGNISSIGMTVVA
jgi:hypothetical protein